MLTNRFYRGLGLRICRAMPLLRDVNTDSFPSFTEQCANTRSRTSDKSFDEFCGLPFDTFSVHLCLRIDVKIYRVSIKSFPDYKHLLQENYSKWNTNIYIYIYIFFFKM